VLAELLFHETGDNQPAFQRNQIHLTGRRDVTACESGGRAESISTARIPRRSDDASQSASPYLEICITDTGIGISADDQQRLSQAFVQLEDSMSRRFECTGLGLALCWEMVKLHDGRIWLTSKKGHGSSFYVALPAVTGLRAARGSDILSWSQLLQRLDAVENIKQRNQVPFALLCLLLPEGAGFLHVTSIVKRVVRSHELIAYGEQPRQA